MTVCRPVRTSRSLIGRHARPDPQKWPDLPEDIYAAYPRSEKFGAHPERGRSWPNGSARSRLNWECLPLGRSPASFLASLDAYVYFHPRR